MLHYEGSTDRKTVYHPVYLKGDSFAHPTGQPVTITYSWNGTRLRPNHSYPKQFQSRSHDTPITMLDMLSSHLGWAVKGNQVLITQDGGAHWKNRIPSALSNSSRKQIKIFGLNPNQGWIAVTTPGSVNNPVHIFHTTDGGKMWASQKFSGVGTPITFQFRNAQQGWIALMQGAAAGSESETIYTTTNGGVTWNIAGTASYQKGTIPFGGDKTGASFRNSKDGWATGFIPMNGRIYLYQTINGGKKWGFQSVNLPSSFKNAEITSYPPILFNQKRGILPVNDGIDFLIYQTKNGGKTWSPKTVIKSSNKTGSAWDWNFPTVKNGIVTDGKEIFATINGGQTWSSWVPNISLHQLLQWQFTSPMQGWALMNSGTLYHTTDGGRVWKRV